MLYNPKSDMLEGVTFTKPNSKLLSLDISAIVEDIQHNYTDSILTLY
jgi:hypothetical protein